MVQATWQPRSYSGTLPSSVRIYANNVRDIRIRQILGHRLHDLTVYIVVVGASCTLPEIPQLCDQVPVILIGQLWRLKIFATSCVWSMADGTGLKDLFTPGKI